MRILGQAAGVGRRAAGFPKYPASVTGLAGLVLLSAAGFVMSGCSGGSSRDPNLGVSSSARVLREGDPIPKGGGTYKLGSPYQVAGRWYAPRHDPDYDRTGIASWYGPDFHGRRTANGEIFDMNALTAAHPTLPLPSYAYVTNLDNGRTILVRVNDRGPYVANRLIDLSRASATALGTTQGGLARVRVRYAGAAPLDGNDRQERQHLASQPWSSSRYADSGAAQAPAFAAPPPRQGGWSAFSYRSGLGAY